MDSQAHKFQPPAVEPGVLYAEHTLDTGEVVSLALVRTRWATEGQAVLERTTEGEGIDLIEHFAWFIRRTDDGPATLGIDDTSKALHGEIDADVLNLLAAFLVEVGSSWGIEAAAVFE